MSPSAHSELVHRPCDGSSPARRLHRAPLALPGALLAAALAGAGGASAQDGHAGPRYGAPERLAELASEEVDESSGLAVSHRAEDAFWTHNDSGGGPRLFLVGRGGEHRATLRVEGAEADDWEDMCSFERGGEAWLLVADTGDNDHARDSVTLYLLREPEAPEDASGAPVAARLEVRYAGGAHDCEAVGVDPASGTVLLVSKERYRPSCRAYTIPLEAFEDDGEEPLEVEPVVDEVPAVPPLTTALDVSPDGRRAVVLTYADAYEFVRVRDEGWADALSREPRRLSMPDRRQGETICYGPDGRSLYLTSEKRPAPLWVVPAE